MQGGNRCLFEEVGGQVEAVPGGVFAGDVEMLANAALLGLPSGITEVDPGGRSARQRAISFQDSPLRILSAGALLVAHGDLASKLASDPINQFLAAWALHPII